MIIKTRQIALLWIELGINVLTDGTATGDPDSGGSFSDILVMA